jgi:hypothetical protein
MELGEGHLASRRVFIRKYNYLQDFNQNIGYLVVFKGAHRAIEVNTRQQAIPSGF